MHTVRIPEPRDQKLCSPSTPRTARTSSPGCWPGGPSSPSRPDAAPCAPRPATGPSCSSGRPRPPAASPPRCGRLERRTSRQTCMNFSACPVSHWAKHSSKRPKVSSPLLKASRSVLSTPGGRHDLLSADRAAFYNPLHAAAPASRAQEQARSVGTRAGALHGQQLPAPQTALQPPQSLTQRPHASPATGPHTSPPRV